MWEFIGNRRVVELLARQTERGEVPHALLFVGPAGVGKTHLALTVARALNCSADERPCGECRECHQILARSHPDVAVTSRLEGKNSFQIEQVRELRELSALKPFQGQWKVYILTGAEDLTPQAADALLKTLEEPAPQVKLILTARNIDSVPETIASRCRVVTFVAPSAAEIEEGLLESSHERTQAQRISLLSRGNVGWALHAAKHPKVADQQEALVERLTQIPDLNVKARLDLAETLTSDRKERAGIRALLELLTLAARDILFAGQGLPTVLTSMEDPGRVVSQANRLGLAAVQTYLQAIRAAMERIDSNVDPRLTLEALFLALP